MQVVWVVWWCTAWILLDAIVELLECTCWCLQCCYWLDVMAVTPSLLTMVWWVSLYCHLLYLLSYDKKYRKGERYPAMIFHKDKLAYFKVKRPWYYMPCNINLGQEVLGRISLMYAMDTLFAILVFSGTVKRYDVNKQIKASACLWPFDDVRRGSVQSMVQPANGSWGISKYIGWVYILLGEIVYIIFNYWYADGCLCACLSTRSNMSSYWQCSLFPSVL